MQVSLSEMHDSALAHLDSEEARRVLAARTEAAAHIRLVVARMYGRGDMMTATQWHVLACLTDQGTIGVVDTARGTAWDSGVAAHPGVHDLGLSAEAISGINHPSMHGSRVLIDGCVVQQDGHTPGKLLSMPAGWRQIALPTWRGYEGTTPYRDVPESEFPPETWIRPRLVAAGLMTCYGEPGSPEITWLAETSEWDASWPHGVPEWVRGRSVTVLDAMARAADYGHGTRLPRLSQAEEMARVERAIRAAMRILARHMRTDGERCLRARRGDVRIHTGDELQAMHEAGACLVECATRIESGDLDLDLTAAVTAAQRATWGLSWWRAESTVTHMGTMAVEVARRELAAGRPSAAARSLGRWFSPHIRELLVAGLGVEEIDDSLAAIA